MPDELTQSQLTELARDLVALEHNMQTLLATTESGAKPVKLKDNQGRLSRMDEMHNQGILLANRNVIRNRLKSVAIARIATENGTYGLCSNCDESIGFNRLKAYPDAAMCISCQSQSE